jgi:hypothetical protein
VPDAMALAQGTECMSMDEKLFVITIATAINRFPLARRRKGISCSSRRRRRWLHPYQSLASLEARRILGMVEAPY